VVRPLPSQKRPEPPSELTAEEAEEWIGVVDRMPAEWFTRETQGQLVNYCRHVVKARVIAGLISGFKPEWAATEDGLHRLDKLLHMAEREGRAIASLGTKMRITQQTRYKAETAHRKVSNPSSSAAPRPWDMAG
jgi:hypothetical protein